MIKKDTKSNSANLRKKAEELLKSKPSTSSSRRVSKTNQPINQSESATLKLLNEMKVYQVELELQNNELMLAKEQGEMAAAKYAELYDFAPTGYFTLSKEGKIIALNLCGSQMLGKERLRLTKSSFGLFVSNDTKSIFNLFLKKVFNSKTKKNCEVVLSVKGNLPMYVYLTGIMTGNGDQCLITAVDMTEHKRAEDESRENEENFRSIFENNSVAIAIIERDSTISMVNEEYCKLSGYTKQEVSGMSWTQQIPPEELKRLKEYTRRRLINPTNAPDKYEFKYYHKNGEVRNALISVTMIQSDRQIIASFIDITERKQAEDEIKRSETALNRQEELLLSLLHNLQMGVFMVEAPSGNPLVANEAAFNILGRGILLDASKQNPSEVCIARKIGNLDPYPPEEMPLLLGMAGKSTHVDDMVIERPDGTNVRLEVFGSPVMDDQGKIWASLMSFFDITERKQAERLQYLSNKILGVLNSNLNLKDMIGGVLKTIQQETKFSALGIRIKSGDDFPYFSQIGFSEDFLTTENTLTVKGRDGGICWEKNGIPCIECFCGLVLSAQADSTNPLFTEQGSFWTNNSPVLSGMSTGKESRHNYRNRCIHEGFLSVALIPIRANEEVVGLLQLNDRKKDCFSHSMMQFFESLCEIIGVALMRKQAEEALEQSHKLLFKLSEQVPGVIYQYRLFPDGRSCFPYSSTGMKDIYEVSPDDVREDATAVFGMLHPDDLERVSELIFESARTLQRFLCEFRVVLPRQGLRWRHSDAIPIRLEDNSTLWHGIIYDITEIKKTESELISAKEKAEESDRLKSAFLANMSHEIRTPMNGILGFAGLLKRPKLTGKERKEYISIIEKSGDRMLNIINDIINISKVESGQMGIYISETNINEQIEYIYTFFKPEVEQKGIQIFFKNPLPAKEAIIKTDREKLYGVFTNLVKNAIKFTSAGSIELGYEKKGKYIEFFVKDTGAGIRQEQKEIIFERFRQGSESHSRNYEGAGLGLSISKAYVELLGGKIWVESALEKGSIFYFTLPYNPAQKEKIAINHVASADGDKDQLKNLKILIVEDDAPSAILIAMAVKIFCKDFLNARTGVEAIEACRNNPDLDLILMDIKMSEMDGYEATRQIRQFNKDVIIIAQTAFGMTSDREKAIEAGCNNYIAKPINIEELTVLVEKYF